MAEVFKSNSNPKADKGEKSGVSVPAIVVAVVALVAFMVWMGMRAFGPEPRPVNDLTIAHDKWMEQIAKETGGDVTKLKPEDLAKLQGETMGHADKVLEAWVKEHGK